MEIFISETPKIFIRRFLDGNSAWTGVDYSLTGGQQKNINLKAKLTANNTVDPGPFSGNAIIYIAFL
ncbi:hypothetical protein FG170_18120 [Serratia marcescens]|nr:hypothetical protein FG170_18120 [Serratia marcescens]